MAEDLVKERRRVLELRRENRRLRADLERLKSALAPTELAAGRERARGPLPRPPPLQIATAPDRRAAVTKKGSSKAMTQAGDVCEPPSASPVPEDAAGPARPDDAA
jgi:hypothetical protein